MRMIAAAALLMTVAPAGAQEHSSGPAFEWPTARSGALADLRVRDDVTEAREAAGQAKTRAVEGRRAAAHAKRRAGVQGALGLTPKPAMVDDDTVVSPTRGRSYGDVLGSITYSTGAVLTGAFGSDVGVYIGGPESPLNRFSGWVWGASSPTPQPRDGVFEWKNGNSFAGSIIGDGRKPRRLHGGRRGTSVRGNNRSEPGRRPSCSWPG